jgi:hypothetical protein
MYRSHDLWQGPRVGFVTRKAPGVGTSRQDFRSIEAIMACTSDSWSHVAKL